MKKSQHLLRSSHRVILFLLLLLVFQPNVLAARGSVQNFYIQAGIGLGLDAFSSNDINNEVSGSIETVGAQLTGRAHIGISNILEVEMQQRIFGSNHQINNQQSAQLDIPVELDFDFLLFKLNPFPFDYGTESEPFYLVYGTANIDYLDDTGFGWQGDGTVYGMEWALMSYRRTYRIGFKVVSATLNRRGGTATTQEYKADHILVDISVAIGF